MEKVGDRIRRRRDQLGMKQEELGALVGMTQQGIATIEDTEEKPGKKRKPTKRPRLIHEIARALRVRVNWLLYAELPMEVAQQGEEQPLEEEDYMIPITGKVTAEGRIDFSVAPGELGYVPPPPDPGDWNALQVTKNAVPPRYSEGHVLFYTSDRFPPEQVVNEECVVSVSGEIWLRTVMKGNGPNRWHLTAPNALAMLNQAVDWATPVSWVRKREAITS